MSNLNKLNDIIIQNYSAFPDVRWFRLILIGLQFLATILCILSYRNSNRIIANAMNQFTGNVPGIRTGNTTTKLIPFNSFHILFWLSVIVFFPVFGAAFYLLFSLINAILYKNRTKEFSFVKNRASLKEAVNKIIPDRLTDRKLDITKKDLRITFDYVRTYFIDKRIWYAVIIAVITGQCLYHSKAVKSEYIAYDVPLIVWMIITFADLYFNYFNNFLILQVSDDFEKLNSGTCSIDEETEKTFRGEESFVVRYCTELFTYGYFSKDILNVISDKVHPFNYSDKTYYTKMICTSKNFKGLFNVLEGQYIGHGVTRYKILKSLSDYTAPSEDETDIYYRVSPPLKKIIIRSFIIFSFIFVISSPAALELNNRLSEFVSRLIGG